MQKFILSLPLFCLALSVGCSSGPIDTTPGNTETLAGLQSMQASKAAISRANSRRMTKIREMGLREIALSLGAQAGLAYRGKQINDELNLQNKHLDAVFDFNALVLEHNVLPPVLLEGRNSLNLANTQNIRVADRTYKVSKQARFITTPPNWRQYLWMDFKKPEYPDLAMLPKTSSEREVWRESITKGWENGVAQANIILDENIARIKEDYVGMILYRKLLAMNMVSPPYVSHTDLGVTGDSEEIRIDDRVLRITALPALNTDAKSWRAAVAMNERALEHLKELESVAQSTEIHITSRAWQPIINPVDNNKND